MNFSPRNILKSELIRNTSVLITGTVVAQLISIFLQPFLRRFFTASEFGTFAVYSSLVGILAVLSTLRFDDAIVLPEKDKDSANLLILSLGFNLIVCLIAFFFILFFGNGFLLTINLAAELPITVLYLVPLGAFLINTYQSFNYWLIRKKKFTNVSINKMVRRGGEGISQISFAFSKTSKGLIFSDIIGQLINVAVIIYQAFRFGFNLKYFSGNKILYVFKKFSDFPKFNLLPAFMSTSSFLLPPIFINKYFSADNAGYFDMAKLVLSIPLALVATSISNVLLQRITEKYNARQSLVDDLRPLLLIVLMICFVEFAVIFLLGNFLFGFAFGSVYEISGEISKIMVWSFAMNFIVSSFSCLFISMRRIKTYSIWQAFYFVAIVSLLFFNKLGFFDFLKVYMAVEVLCYLAAAFIMVSMVRRYEKTIKLI